MTALARPNPANATSEDLASAGRGNWRRRDIAVIAAIGAIEGMLRMTAPGDGDIFWGAQSGLDTLRHGIPRHDTYSWSAAGHTWIPSSWGWNVVLGVFYDAFGTAGFVLVAALLGAGLGAVISQLAHRIGARPLPTAFVVAVMGVFALGGAPRATAVSTTLAPLVLIPLPAILAASSARWWRALAVLVGIQVVWVNLHSGALIAPGLVLAFGAGLIVRTPPVERQAAAMRLVLALGLVTAACLATPYGWSLIEHAPQVRAASVGLIEEWRRYTPSMALSPEGAAGFALVVLSVVTALRARRFESVLVLLLMIGLTVSAVRFVAPLLVFVMPEVGRYVGGLAIRARFFIVATVVVLAGLGGAALKGLIDIHQTEQFRASPRLVRELPSGCHLFNDDVIGGAVILHRHDVPVWTDGRNDMYGRAQTLLTLRLRDGGPGAVRWLDRNKITCVLVQSSDGLVKRLAHTNGWQRLDSDQERMLFVRTYVG
jgi:hypothetical protein